MKTERFQRLAEQDRVISSEQKRYTLERNCEKLRGQNLKLSVKVEELQMKYEPGKLNLISMTHYSHLSDIISVLHDEQSLEFGHVVYV